MENNKKPEMKCGLVTMTTPVELNIVKSKYILKLKNRETTLKWNTSSLYLDEIEALKGFVDFVYKAGFADGSIVAMNISKINPVQEQESKIQIKNWISVKDKLPMEVDDEWSEQVIINVLANGHNHTSTGRTYNREWYWNENCKKMSDGFVVTHWKYLPEFEEQESINDEFGSVDLTNVEPDKLKPITLWDAYKKLHPFMEQESSIAKIETDTGHLVDMPDLPKPENKLFAFEPHHTGPDSIYVMSDTKENAIEAVKKLKDTKRGCDYIKKPEEYTITEHQQNDAVWSENA